MITPWHKNIHLCLSIFTWRRVKCLNVLAVLSLIVLSTYPSIADESTPSYFATGPHIEVTLLSKQSALVAGETITLGVLFSPEEEWHTYWRNPGDSGEAPTIKWQSELGLGFGDIQWPLPYAIKIAHLVNYGYEGQNLLMVPVTVPSNMLMVDEVTITADISWLVCKEDCIPGWATLSISLPLQSVAQNTVHASLFEETTALLPSPTWLEGRFEITPNDLVFEMPNLFNKSASDASWHLFPFGTAVVNHAASQQILSDQTNTRFVVPRSDYYNATTKQIEFLVSNGQQGFYVNALLSDTAGTAGKETLGGYVSSLLVLMLMAFAGGLILNLMPCVLPILSIKAMALQNIKQSAGHKVAYLLGVLACFNVFAVIILLLQQSGQQVGWGFHMQEPVVVLLLAFLFTFIGLVLLDALAVSGRFAGIGQSLVMGDTAKSHFATGALAVIVASPCTAPFMAAALGVAMVSEPYITFLLFNALAVGFALPLTLLFMSSKASRWLPKPGQWMVTFKHLLAFPMFVTVAWLAWVFSGQLGAQAQFVLLLGLILFCMFAWLLDKAAGAGAKIALSTGLVLSMALPMWLSVSMPPVGVKNIANQGLDSIAFNKERLQTLRSNNQVVVINMTADWCITCKVNEQVAFSSSSVKQALQQENVHYMVGDWTNKNAEILAYLTQYERAGVPLYVVYAGTQSKQVLPQILTPNTLIDAISRANKELNRENSQQ